MLLFTRTIIIVLLASGLVSSLGCQASPRYQAALNNLRAEKIQLENQYYWLKNQYESDMRRLGQPVDCGPAPGVVSGQYSGMGGGYPDGMIINEPGLPVGEWSSPPARQPVMTPGIDSAGIHSVIPADPDQDADMARYIADVDVNQIPGQGGESARLLIRPLDEQGAVIPMTGALSVELFDAASGRMLANFKYDQIQVSGMVRPADQFPGIHLGLPGLSSAPSSGQVNCRLQFRTLDNRVLQRETVLIMGGIPSSAGGSASNPIPARQASSQLSDTPGLDDIFVEIGPETTFGGPADSGQAPRPRWSPDR